MFSRPWPLALRVTLLGLLGASFSACRGGGSPTSVGTLAIQLTDDPTDEVSQVNVYINGLMVKHDQRPVERIARNVGIVDLLSLQDTTQLLATAGVEAGVYEFIIIELEETQSSVVEKASGAQVSVNIPSEEIKVLGRFEVEEGGQTTVTLDFDARESLVKLGNGNWLLKPVIAIARVEQS